MSAKKQSDNRNACKRTTSKSWSQTTFSKVLFFKCKAKLSHQFKRTLSKAPITSLFRWTNKSVQSQYHFQSKQIQMIRLSESAQKTNKKRRELLSPKLSSWNERSQSKKWLSWSPKQKSFSKLLLAKPKNYNGPYKIKPPNPGLPALNLGSWTAANLHNKWNRHYYRESKLYLNTHIRLKADLSRSCCSK